MNPTVARTDVTTAISTAPRWNPVVSTYNMRCFGDGERTVNFREPLYNTGMKRQLEERLPLVPQQGPLEDGEAQADGECNADTQDEPLGG